MDIVDKIMAYEGGYMEEEKVIEFFQELLDTGMVHRLQGSYGRTATALIEGGLINVNDNLSVTN